jgi:hypothetical protein
VIENQLSTLMIIHMKKILYAISTILLFVSAYFVYLWFVSEPDNREPLPTLISLVSTIILTIIAWKSDGNNKDKVKVKRVDKSTIILEQEKGTDISVVDIKENSKVIINQGKDSLKRGNR